MSNSLTSVQSTDPRRNLTWLLLLGLSQALLATSSGCRSTSDNQIDLLERELRVQEDYIYELEDYVVEYSEKLRDCRSCPQQTAVYSEEIYEAEPAPKRTRKSNLRRSNLRKSDKERSVLESEKDDLPAPFESDRPPEFSPEDIEVPDEIDLEIGEPVSEVDNPRLDALEQGYEFADEGSILIPDPVDYPSNLPVDEIIVNNIIGEEVFEEEVFEEGIVGEEELDDAQFVADFFEDELFEPSSAVVERVAERLEVTQLFHNEGEGERGDHSPQSLLTVVEALDSNDEPVDLEGTVSLMVMTVDQAKSERLKRWDFTAEETVAAWQSSDLGDGLHLELPLEKLNLPAVPLELWVRMVTTDGRKLLTQLPFDPSQLSDVSKDVSNAVSKDVASAAPESLPLGLSLVKVEETPDDTSEPINSIRIETTSISNSENLQLAQSEEPDNQPRWRASMQRTDHTAEGFATTSGKLQVWTTQAPGRQPYVPPRVATRPMPVQSKAPARPVWTSGRTIHPR